MYIHIQGDTHRTYAAEMPPSEAVFLACPLPSPSSRLPCLVRCFFASACPVTAP